MNHCAFDAQASPTKWPAGLFNICTGCYDFSQAFGVSAPSGHSL